MCSYLVGVRVRVRVGVRVRVRVKVRVKVWVRAMCSYSGSLVLTSPPKTHTFRPPAKLVRVTGVGVGVGVRLGLGLGARVRPEQLHLAHWWCHIVAGASPVALASRHWTVAPSASQKESRVSCSSPPCTGSPRSC